MDITWQNMDKVAKILGIKIQKLLNYYYRIYQKKTPTFFEPYLYVQWCLPDLP